MWKVPNTFLMYLIIGLTLSLTVISNDIHHTGQCAGTFIRTLLSKAALVALSFEFMVSWMG